MYISCYKSLNSLDSQVMNNTRYIISIAFFCAFFIVGNIHGKKKLQKDTDGSKILKKITTGLEKCVKNQTSVDNKKISSHFTKCITATENKKSLLKDKKKTTKNFLKKVLKGISNCLKSKMTKKTKKPKDKKKPKSNNKREKRSKRPSNAEEEVNQALAKVSKCGDVVTDVGKVEKCECGRAEMTQSGTSSNARIFKGKETLEKQHPWYILIQISYKDSSGKTFSQHSGGALISRKHVLTVAHSFFELHTKNKR